jgi:hypothetical protein
MKPQFTGKADRQLDDHEFLALSQLARGIRVLQIGNLQGRLTDALAQNAEHIISIDQSKMNEEVSLLNPKDFDLLFYDADDTVQDIQFFCDWALNVRHDAIVVIHDYKPGDPIWQPSVDVMDKWHTDSGRMAKLIGSLFIAVNQQIPYGQHLGTENYPEKIETD